MLICHHTPVCRRVYHVSFILKMHTHIHILNKQTNKNHIQKLSSPSILTLLPISPLLSPDCLFERIACTCSLYFFTLLSPLGFCELKMLFGVKKYLFTPVLVCILHEIGWILLLDIFCCCCCCSKLTPQENLLTYNS